MTPAERVKAHYEAHCEEGRASVAVAEWGDEEEPFTIYWKPVTLRDFGVAFPEMTASPIGMVRLIARKAEDKDGKRLFPEQEDRRVLEFNAEFTVIRRIAEQMLAPLSLQDVIARQVLDNLRSGAFWVADKLGKTIEEIEVLPVKAFLETIEFYAKREQQ